MGEVKAIINEKSKDVPTREYCDKHFDSNCSESKVCNYKGNNGGDAFVDGMEE